MTLDEATLALALARQTTAAAQTALTTAQTNLTMAAQAQNEAQRVYDALFATAIGDGEEEPEPETFAGRKTAKLTAIRERQAKAKNAGIVVGGIPIRTTSSSLQDISAAVTAFSIDPEMTSVEYEAQPGAWVVIDKAEMIAIGVAVGRYIQACQANARVLSEAATAAADDAALDAVDIESGWPGEEI